jgi:uncharacterized protein (DUF2126 family)/transglutaminase-like putative cysteine protease
VTIRVAVEHRTSYRFDRPVAVHPHVIRLRPAPHCRTPISAYSLTVTPAEHFVNWQQDAFGNHLARLVFPEKTAELSFTVDLVAELTVINPFDFFLDDYAEKAPFGYPAELRADLEPYLRPVDEDESAPGSGPGPLLRQWVKNFSVPHGEPIRTVDFLVQLNHRIRETVAYTLRMEPGVQTPDETLERAVGSCRDSAWLLVSVLRELGLAARFVSGYLLQLVPDAPAAPGPTAQTAPSTFTQDFTDLHAWAEVYVPGAGWIGLDATSGLFAGEGHIPLAATPHWSSAAPVTGAIDPAEVEFDFANVITRLHEDPRVTFPYAEQQWRRVQATGLQVDRLLADGDVRLTMGGEPTFIAADDMESEQWSTAADGDEKRERAARLARLSVERWAPNGVVHYGQGKWYPGEPLPRWQIGITWRQDGEPIWSDAALLDEPWGSARLKPGGKRARKAARALARDLSRRLGVPTELCLPAYEDAMHALWEQARQPAGEPVQEDVEAGPSTAEQRIARFAELDARLGHPAGWVIPLHRAEDDTGWETESWQFRRGQLVLLPGTSPLGLRLPLDGLAWTPPAATPDRSPFEPRESLPPSSSQRLSGASGSSAASGLSDPPGPSDRPGSSEGSGVRDGFGPWAWPEPKSSDRPSLPLGDVEHSPRTALCVQERDGHLFVFLPPLTALEHALELLAVVEASVAETGVPVVLEGYPLPSDPRTATLTVTPDPGVIEVNVHPAGSWPELVAITEGLDADARAVGLATEKFAVDGLHTGTGGGSHLTLGGAKAADSPLLRRPDLLRSLITYWQHHPGLSYLFSGRFVGPTSQAPRVDEGRHETLYELEIAFAELDRYQRENPGQSAPPWLVDRALRHLLTDLTGNTHRSEFCIDKLFSPDSERGRLGLLELRGFEMPPHPQMSMVQALLVRSLVARFWAEPYSGDLVRWGTELHDRFLLPSPVAADLADVVADLRAHGIDFEPGWLEPFLEFRFPRLGQVMLGDVELELRQAVEPWNVLGEEATAGGTARYVDSSVERVELRARGVTAGRHLITCNGVPVPLTSTGIVGEAAAGIRFTAWAPPSKLHPTIGVQSPLVVDLIDRWNGRSIGGFRYHVSHPGGLSYQTFPVNAAEAEARRDSRFVAHGHTPGRVDLSGWPDGGAFGGAFGSTFGGAAGSAAGRGGHSEYPRTLDLRRQDPGTHGRITE